MEKTIMLDGLNEYAVSVRIQKSATIDGEEYNLGVERQAYVNSAEGRLEIASKLPEPYASAVLAVWGDEPTVVPEPETQEPVDDEVGGENA